MNTNAQPVSILIAALGGEGGGVLTEWLVAAAARAGFAAQSTSIPGVAQRTGATTYYVEIYPVPLAELDGRVPVLGLLPVPGRIDLVVASELLEAVRVVHSRHDDAGAHASRHVDVAHAHHGGEDASGRRPFRFGIAAGRRAPLEPGRRRLRYGGARA